MLCLTWSDKNMPYVWYTYKFQACQCSYFANMCIFKGEEYATEMFYKMYCKCCGFQHHIDCDLILSCHDNVRCILNNAKAKCTTWQQFSKRNLLNTKIDRHCKIISIEIEDWILFIVRSFFTLFLYWITHPLSQLNRNFIVDTIGERFQFMNVNLFV